MFVMSVACIDNWTILFRTFHDRLAISGSIVMQKWPSLLTKFEQFTHYLVTPGVYHNQHEAPESRKVLFL